MTTHSEFETNTSIIVLDLALVWNEFDLLSSIMCLYTTVKYVSLNSLIQMNTYKKIVLRF